MIDTIISVSILIVCFFIWRISYYLLLMLDNLKDITKELYDIGYFLQELNN